MKLILGETIKRLRRQRELTQEEVAAHLGISFQSISKWERGDGYPDITLLPALANYFGVTIDELMGRNELEQAQHYEEINRLWAEQNCAGKHEENLSLLRDALREYPNDALLLVQLSTSLEKCGTTPEEISANLKESIAVQEQILRYGEDSEVRGATMYNICFAYQKNGDKQKALEQAKKLPNLYKARENALVLLQEGEEKHRAALSALEPLAWIIAQHMRVLAESEGDPSYRQRAKEILDLLLAGHESDLTRAYRKILE